MFSLENSQKEKYGFFKMMCLHSRYSTVKISSWCLWLMRTAHPVPFTGNGFFFSNGCFFYLKAMQMQAEWNKGRCLPYSLFGWDLIVCHYWWLQSWLCFVICVKLPDFKMRAPTGAAVFLYTVMDFLGRSWGGRAVFKIVLPQKTVGLSLLSRSKSEVDLPSS